MNDMTVFASIISSVKEGGKVLVPDEPFDTVTGPDGNEWLTMFTSAGEIEGPEKNSRTKEVPIAAVMKKALGDPGIKGIVINPYTDGFEVSKPALEFMLRVTGSGVQIEIISGDEEIAV